MIEQPSHGDSLFLTAGENVVPVVNGVESAFALLEILEFDL
jgi:hypothetical protein